MRGRRAHLSFAVGLIAGEVTDLSKEWMQPANQLPDDDPLLTIVCEALAKHRPRSRARGQMGASAEVVPEVIENIHKKDGHGNDVEQEP